MDGGKESRDAPSNTGRHSKEWAEARSSPNNFSNHNVWYYYYLDGDASDAYGPLPTAAILKECESLGIEIGRCSEERILGRHCLGSGCEDASSAAGNLDMTLAVLFAVASVGIIVGILTGSRLKR
jgi:hypothetical protein